ncbi:MAG: hypothetical protein HYX84_02710 [Chloroflexi bacterium]|nr:hypothetical protein [Chloroflexota bacterium]
MVWTIFKSKATAMLKQLKNFVDKNPDRCEECDVCLQLTGEQPANRAEEIVKRIVGNRQVVSLHWLEEQLSQALYRDELGHNAWAVDIGIWGASCFGPEVARLMTELRPQFAVLIKEGETATIAPQTALKNVASGKPLYGDC